MAGETKRQRQVKAETPQFTETEIQDRTRWLMFNFDMCTGKYLRTPPWQQAATAEQEGGGDGG